MSDRDVIAAHTAIRACSICGGKAVARGLCGPHYKRAMRSGELPPKLNVEQERRRRFWANVNKTDSCWDWVGYVTRHGYGNFGHGIAGLTMRAHKLAWEWENGPVPEGLVLDHLCRNRKCVRPEHLEPATPRINALRGIGPTALNSRKSKCKKGHALSENRECRVCRRQVKRKHDAKAKARRSAVQCGHPTRDSGPCALRVAVGKRCRNHDVWNIGLPLQVLYRPDEDGAL